MTPRDPLLRLAARLARGVFVDWEAEERAATTEKTRDAIRKLRLVAAVSHVSRAALSGTGHEDLAQSVSTAKTLANGAPALTPGSRWGLLEIQERVGHGAFGEVYRARDPHLDREVALKILSRDLCSPDDEVIREARLLAAVRHPNVVTVHGADRLGGQVGIWTEFLRGQTLERILRERGVLDGREAALVAIDLCRALAAAHAAGIIHQDVKLSNVMRAEGGRIVLMDFGLGREIEPLAAIGSERRLSGTPLFMSPEALRGDRPDARMDLYSVGVVLFALVTGALPVEASSLDALRRKHELGERRQARDLRPDLSAGLVRVLDRSLCPDPRGRYRTAGDLERALLECLLTPVYAGEPGRPDTTDSPPGAVPSLPGRQHRLPEERDAFIGRGPELAALSERFQGGTRLVTLLGPGGIGKTRLAARYGRTCLPSWPGGVWFVDLTEARTRDGIAAAVGETLAVPLSGGDVVEQLGDAIAHRGPCLLILDNFEQVAEQASSTIGPWLARAPEARILVTSRVRLDLPGASVLRIEAMPLEEGIALFVERARGQRPIDADGPEGASVRELVRLVEGMPLAIELSAARLSVMTPAQIVERITERFRILAGSGSGRHATLRAAIDGSWETLKTWERAAFAQAAVFEGGFTLDAAEGVLDLRAWPEAPWVVDVLQALVDKSLLRSWILIDDSPRTPRPGQPAMRFGMFVSLQEYARERLAEEEAIPGGSGAAAVAAAEQRHARWFARFGEDAAIDALDAPGGTERRQALAAELGNLVEATRRMTARGEGAIAIRVFRAAWAVMELRGPFAAVVELGSGVATLPLTPSDRARLLTSIGRAKQLMGRLGDARSDLQDALAIQRESGERAGEARTFANLATVALNDGRIEEALPDLERALALLRAVGDRRAEGAALGNLGLAHHERGRLDEASSALEAALAIQREVGSRRSEGVVLGNLGNLRTDQGRHDEARAHLEAALAIHTEVGNRRFEAIARANLGTLCKAQGRLDEAKTHFAMALAIHREVGARRFQGQMLDNLGQIYLQQGNQHEARVALEVACAIFGEIGNARHEGIVLGHLATVLLEDGRTTEARAHLLRAETLLQAPAYRSELAALLCIRAELEWRSGEAPAARATLERAEGMVGSTAPPEPELERCLARVRRTLAES